jgi:hypothetical protein
MNDYSDDEECYFDHLIMGEIELYDEIIKISPKTYGSGRSLKRTDSTTSLAEMIAKSIPGNVEIKIVKKSPSQISAEVYSMYFSEYHSEILDFVDDLNLTYIQFQCPEINITKNTDFLIDLMFELYNTVSPKIIHPLPALKGDHRKFKKWESEYENEIEFLYEKINDFCYTNFESEIDFNKIKHFLWNSSC